MNILLTYQIRSYAVQLSQLFLPFDLLLQVLKIKLSFIKYIDTKQYKSLRNGITAALKAG